jgi:cytochrome c oxidase cbb3-type subunit 2
MTLFLGCLLTFTSSWLGLVIAPFVQLRLKPVVLNDRDEEVKPDEPPSLTNRVYPKPRVGLAAEGRKVYQANGCIYCHSQQVRPEGFGADLARGWGGKTNRRTVPLDYIYDRPIMLGTMRTGPDLANAGLRRTFDWQHRHLYNPRMETPGSSMPAFSFLYEQVPIVGEPSVDALVFSPEWADSEWAPKPGHQIVPRAEAKALVAYLMSLDHSDPIPEAD